MSNGRRAIVGVALLAGLGLLLGYARDVSIAALFGLSSTSDAFFAGTFFPLLVQQVALAGSLAPALLPLLAQGGAVGRMEARLVGRLALGVTALAGGLVLVGWLAATPLIAAFAVGLPPATQALATDLFRLSLPMLLPLAPATVLAAYLNYHGRFLVPAAAAALFNATVVLTLLAFYPRLGIGSAALGMTLGGGVQLVVLLPAVWRLRQPVDPGVPMRPLSSALPHPYTAIARFAAPLLATVAVGQGVAVVERVLATQVGAGALSTLNYAMKLNLLPSILFAGALTTVLFPTLARLAPAAPSPVASAPNLPAYAANLRAGLAGVIGWTAPAAALLVACAEPLVRLVYQRQHFSPAASAATAQVLALYALGLVPLALNVLLPRAYHARRDMRTPLVATAAGTGLYVVLALASSLWAGVAGLALALSLANGVQMALLLLGLRRVLAGEWAALATRAARAGLAAGLMGLGCAVGRAGLDAAGVWTGPFVGQVIALGALTLIGAGGFWLLDSGLRQAGLAWGEAARPTRPAPNVAPVEVE